MPDAADHRADMHCLATERSTVGTLRLADVFQDDNLTFGQKRDAIVTRIRASAWLKDKGEHDDLVYLVEELADAEDNGSFNSVWSKIYDIADADGVWIETR